MIQNATQVVDSADKLVEFRDDLRQPKIVFGRCALTGEWGKCVALDLGDICIQAPDTENGVTKDEETGEFTFEYWKPVTFENQITLSESGLKMILAYAESQDNPIPSISPELLYKWQVSYDDGSALTQYRFNPETSQEEEVNSKEIDFARIAQLTVLPRYPGDTTLPTFTLVKETGKFFKDGSEIDLMYDGAYLPEADIVYARKMTHTWGSQINGLDRGITTTHTTVLQLLGWKVGGLKGPGPGCIIAIDDRGNWRPWEYEYGD
jgi:hypothetical protein